MPGNLHSARCVIVVPEGSDVAKGPESNHPSLLLTTVGPPSVRITSSPTMLQ